MCWSVGVRGGVTSSPRVLSFLMCQFHSCSSCAVSSQGCIFPSLLRSFVVVYLPMILFCVMTYSVISFGRRVWSDFTMAFMLVVSTPSLGHGFLFHAVSTVKTGV